MKLIPYFADISSNNPRFNAMQYASGGFAAIAIKATEDTGYINPEYAGWVAAARRYRLPIFHYHFARPEHGNPHGQAVHFWDVVHDHFRRPGDYVVVDIETGTPREGAVWLREYDYSLRNISGTHPLGYTYDAYFEEGALTINSKQWWLAALGGSRPGNALWHLARGQNLFAWQFSFSAETAGIGACDRSVLNPSVMRELKKVRK